MTARLLLLVALATGCNDASPGTSVRIALSYPGDLGLDTADVTIGQATKPTAISHELLLLLPDELDGQNLPLEIWGKSHDQRAAHGVTTVTPKRDQTVDATLELTVCAPRCEGDMVMGCGEPVACAMGCSSDGDAHCITATPSNGVDATLVDTVTGTTTIAMDATFDTDTGAITDGLTRAPVKGLDAGIGYYQAAAVTADGVPLGVFVFHDLTVATGVTIRFTGTRGAVLLVGDAATIDGAIQVAGGSDGVQSTPGPGGGAGALPGRRAGGCGPGADGGRSGVEDGGGGGGGGSTSGGPGGRLALRGEGGPSCIPPLLEPLMGGAGGGRGGLGAAATSAGGGGGGGAFQLTALGSIMITGTIDAGGAGGDAGAQTVIDAGGGGGGGAGGGILLEAPSVVMLGSGILAANGGGGGGGGGAFNTNTPAPGANGGLSTTVPPQGGAGGEELNSGGSGGGAVSPGLPDVGNDGTTNGGGGGGGIGVIVVRGTRVTLMGPSSPQATRAPLRAPR